MTSKPRQFTDADVRWEARRQAPVKAGTSSQGFYPGKPREPGISFTSDAGDHRFLKMTYPNELPSQKEFENMSEAQLVDLLALVSSQGS